MTPTVSVTGAPNPRTAAGSVTYTVTVTGVTGFIPTGAVTVSDGTRTCSIRALNGSGGGNCHITEPAGAFTVTATYAGNIDYNSASGTTTETIE